MLQEFRFFEEYTRPDLAQSAGNVIAVHMTGDSFVKEGEVCFHALCAHPDGGPPNSDVLARLCTAEYLGTYCRLVSEDRARAIHPKLFEYLDTIS